MLRLLFLLAGALLASLSFRVPVRALADGGRTLEAFWAGALGVASLALGIGWVRGWRRAALRCAGLALALAAQLTVTQPAWLQFVELRLWRLAEDPLLDAAWGVVGLQLAWAGRTAALHRARAAELLRPLRRPAVLVPGALLFLLCAAHATRVFEAETQRVAARAVGLYLLQLPVVGALLAANVVHLAAIGAALPAEPLGRARRALSRVLSLPGGELPPTALDRALPWLLAGCAAAASAALCWLALDRVPHVPDGVPYLFQARCLAALRLGAELPPVPEAFEVYLIDRVGERLVGVTNPGWPAVLALGSLVRAEWLVNPLLAGVAVLCAHALVRRIADRGTAHGVSLLLATSPWLLWVSASFMTHATTLALLCAGWLAVRSERALGALAGGVAMGLVCCVRPLDGLLAGTLTGVWILGLGGRRVPLACIPLYALGCAGGAALLLLYNRGVAGDPLVFPINAYLDRIWYPGANRLGFGPDVGNPKGWSAQDPLPGHGPWDVLLNTNQNLYNLNFELLGWGTGSLAFAALHVLLGRRSRQDRAALAFLGTLAIFYSTYWFSGGSDYGARYWYPMLLPLVWLTWRGLGTLAALAEERVEHGAARVWVLAGVQIALSLALFVPWRAAAKYADYRGFHGDFRALARSPSARGALVLVEVSDASEYGLAFLENDPRWGPDSPVFAWARNAETERRLREAWPDRPVLRARGRSVTGGRIAVERAPAPPAAPAPPSGAGS